MSVDDKTAKKRVIDLFRYIKEIKTRVDKPILDEKEYEWRLGLGELPDHPCVQLVLSEEVVLKIKRPDEVKCPPPTPELMEWIKPSWNKIKNEIEVLESRNLTDAEKRTQTIFFKDYPDLLKKLEEWKIKREAWKKAELPSEAVRETFSRLHEIKAKIDKDSEKIQLYLSDGVLVSPSTQGNVHHPLIFKEISLKFDDSKKEPEFIISKSDNPSFLNLGLLRFIGIDGSLIAKKKNEFEDLCCDPDESANTTDFLRGLAHYFWPNGKYSDVVISKAEEPTIYRNLKIVLGKKQDHFIEQIEAYIKKVESLTQLPIAFENIVGRFSESQEPPPIPGSTGEQSLKIENKKIAEFFLTKEYNSEQKQIIELLEKKGAVSVQGPPGTGKSHTIANLIGHLLATGNSVIVSSYTTKALNVIRDKVVDELQPLCVSVLDQDVESKKQLEQSVNYIDEMLSKPDIQNLDERIKSLSDKKKSLGHDISVLEKKFSEMILNEYRPIAYIGESILPKHAALFVQEHSKKTIISGPFKTEISPISQDDFASLVSVFKEVSPQEQIACESGLPILSKLITPEEVEVLIDEGKKLISEKKKLDKILLSNISSASVDELKSIQSSLLKVSDSLIGEQWQLEVLDSCFKGQGFNKIITDCISEFDAIIQEIEKYSLLVFKHQASLDHDYDIDALIAVTMKFSNLSSQKVEIGIFDRMFSKEVKIITEHSRIGNRKAITAEEFLSINHFLHLKKYRKILCEKWDSFFHGKFKSLPSKEFSSTPELEITHYLKTLRRQLSTVNDWAEVVKLLASKNISWPTDRHDEFKVKAGENLRHLEAIKNEICMIFVPCFEFSIREKIFLAAKSKLDLTIAYLQNQPDLFSRQLLFSLQKLDAESYKAQIKIVFELTSKSKMLADVQSVTEKLKLVVPVFYENLRSRKIDDELIATTEWTTTWKASYLEWVIACRNHEDPVQVQAELSEKKEILKNLNSELIKNLVWRNQISRTKPELRQALRGWVQAQNKITKQGRGVLDDFRRKESRTLLRTCRSAVPVWIMPLSKVLDNFKLGEDMFDVLIIDEASQADLTNLPIFAIARKVIVVGDDKQVSPPDAGKKQQGLEGLIQEFLTNIPNKQNYDFKYSIYDIACSSFGDTVRLSEHFRCVPEIIQFCNDLSYGGTIKVLRESSSNPTSPALVPCYVEGSCIDDINHKEAEMIVSLIMTMKDRPEYYGKHFGVISLKGQKQHLYIDDLLRSKLSAKDYEKLKILCGKAPQFQGDERDVIFLSMVSSPDSEGPLTLESETDAKSKEYNVAVSRAKNQLWILHSMNPETQLKPDDIRLRLLKHAFDPRSLVEKYAEIIKKAESPFEKSIHEDLLRAGFHFIPQYEVGAYRIDLVLYSKDGSRIAFECDGDKYHTTEDQVRQDLNRQAVLERLGFKFIRVRGSDYYRRKEQTLTKIFQKLNDYGVVPNYVHSSAIAPSKINIQLLISDAISRLITEEEDEKTNDQKLA